MLKAALLQRATEDIRRILAVRNAKPALANLLARGSVGDDLWQRFLRAEKEMESELRDVVEEVLEFPPIPLSKPHGTCQSLTPPTPGQRPLAQLGPINIPKRKRNGPERNHAQKDRRTARAG